MTIQWVGYGDLTQTKCQTLMCTTNTVGVMGAGIALSVRTRWPEVYQQYLELYRCGLLDIHRLDVIPISDEQQVLLFPTKKSWRNASQKEWVTANLEQLAADYEQLGITSLAMPLPGCGQGGIHPSWGTVEVYRHFAQHPLPVELYLGR